MTGVRGEDNADKKCCVVCGEVLHYPDYHKGQVGNYYCEKCWEKLLGRGAGRW